MNLKTSNKCVQTRTTTRTYCMRYTFASRNLQSGYTYARTRLLSFVGCKHAEIELHDGHLHHPVQWRNFRTLLKARVLMLHKAPRHSKQPHRHWTTSHKSCFFALLPFTSGMYILYSLERFLVCFQYKQSSDPPRMNECLKQIDTPASQAKPSHTAILTDSTLHPFAASGGQPLTASDANKHRQQQH